MTIQLEPVDGFRPGLQRKMEVEPEQGLVPGVGTERVLDVPPPPYGRLIVVADDHDPEIRIPQPQP